MTPVVNTPIPIDVTSLISQVQSIAADYSQSAADAEKWRTLRLMLEQMGYGPLITPDQIADLVPPAKLIQQIVDASAKPRKTWTKKSTAVAGNGADPGAAEPGALEA